MAKGTIKTKSKSFSSTEITDTQITRLMEKLNLISESEALRYCVGYVHKKEFPDYILTANGYVLLMVGNFIWFTALGILFTQ